MSTSGGPRLFVALAPPAALVLPLFEAARASLTAAEDWLRFPRSDGLHVTLEFLGPLEPEARERLLAGLEALGTPVAPRLELGGAGAFPRRGAEQVLWLGVRPAAGQAAALEALVSGVRGALREAGLQTDADGSRVYRPHLTVARVRPRRRPRGAELPIEFWELEGGVPWTPTELLLCESVRVGPGPPRYPALWRRDLAAPRAG